MLHVLNKPKIIHAFFHVSFNVFENTKYIYCVLLKKRKDYPGSPYLNCSLTQKYFQNWKHVSPEFGLSPLPLSAPVCNILKSLQTNLSTI